MSDLQATMDGWSAQWQRERAETQMTLGALIEALEAMPADAEVANLTAPHSDRGYYCDLAFEPGEGTRPASALLAECRAAMGGVFTGYKGGNYVMGTRTPVWVAEYGDCGRRLLAVSDGGAIETAADEGEE